MSIVNDNMSDTPETEIIKGLIENLNLWSKEYRCKPISLSLLRAATILTELKQEQDEARELLESEKTTRNHIIQRGNEMQKELAEAREQVKELIYIAERAIDLAEIDFENDKFGVVSELRDSLEKIKKESK